MAILQILSVAQNGAYYSNVAKAVGSTENEARIAISHVAPAIANQLKLNAAASSENFDVLLDIIEDDANAADLADEALVSQDAVEDGAVILSSIYGSASAAHAALLPLSPVHTDLYSAYAATAVVACLAAVNSRQTAKLGLASSPKSDSIIATIISALLSGLLKGILAQLAPKRRRTGSYYKRSSPARRRATRPNLDDIFREILTPKK